MSNENFKSLNTLMAENQDVMLMASDEDKKIVTLDLLKDVKVYIDAKDTAIDAKSLKSGKYENNTIYLYNSTDKTGDVAVTLELPKEMFLDQTQTKFVSNFEWSASLYPNSTDASKLNGQPVLVLAVKGEDNSVSYSFLSISEAITIYKGGSTDTATTTVTGDVITTDVKVSNKANNLVKSDTNGLYILPATGSDGITKVEVSDENVISVTPKASQKKNNPVIIEDDGIYVTSPKINTETIIDEKTFEDLGWYTLTDADADQMIETASDVWNTTLIDVTFDENGTHCKVGSVELNNELINYKNINGMKLTVTKSPAITIIPKLPFDQYTVLEIEFVAETNDPVERNDYQNLFYYGVNSENIRMGNGYGEYRLEIESWSNSEANIKTTFTSEEMSGCFKCKMTLSNNYFSFLMTNRNTGRVIRKIDNQVNNAFKIKNQPITFGAYKNYYLKSVKVRAK